MSRRSVSTLSNKAAKAAALLLVGGSTFACIFEQSNYEFGGRRTDPEPAVNLNESDESCPQGSCNQICGQQVGLNVVGENCKCIGGKCKQQCGQGSTCTCSAGGCTQQCAPKARCACSGGRCNQTCEKDSICTCGGENCTCTGEGCNPP